MIIDVLASGSNGNAYIIDDGQTNILLECGIPFNELKIKTNFFERIPDGCLISHEHKDHSFAFEDIRKMGVQLYMAPTTMTSLLGLHGSDYNMNQIHDNERFEIGTFRILPLQMHHDVYCLGFMMYSTATKERVFFATDTYFIKQLIPPVDYIMVEANYDLEILNERIRNGDTDMVAKERLMRSHMEINSTLRWLEMIDLRRTKRIYLLHLSDGSSNEKEFKRRVMEATGVPVTVC